MNLSDQESEERDEVTDVSVNCLREKAASSLISSDMKEIFSNRDEVFQSIL